MLMGALVYGIRYTVPEYLCTFLVAGGVSTFALLKVMILSILTTFFCFHFDPRFIFLRQIIIIIFISK